MDNCKKNNENNSNIEYIGVDNEKMNLGDVIINYPNVINNVICYDTYMSNYLVSSSYNYCNKVEYIDLKKAEHINFINIDDYENIINNNDENNYYSNNDDYEDIINNNDENNYYSNNDDFIFYDDNKNNSNETIIDAKYRELYSNIYFEVRLNVFSSHKNMNFCFFCKNYMVVPNYEIFNFLTKHLSLNKYSKYLIIVFRLQPDLFTGIDIMKNKYLRKYILNYLNIQEKNVLNDVDYLMLYKNKLKNCTIEYIYENLFHQPNLTYIDYIKCDSCKNYLCPMHIYLSNSLYKSCDICNVQKWTICGWCKNDFDEKYACKYMHNLTKN